MLTKDRLLKTLKDLPEEFSIDELLDRIVLFQKVEAGLRQTEEGKTYSTTEAKEKLKKWLK